MNNPENHLTPMPKVKDFVDMSLDISKLRNWKLRQEGEKKYLAAWNTWLEDVKTKIKSSQFVLLEIQVDDSTEILYRGKPCAILEVSNDKAELEALMTITQYHDEDINPKNLRIVQSRILKF